MLEEIFIYDTYSREKRLFNPIEYECVKIYTCGPTVYNYPHIGNLRAYIFSDTLRRMFEFNGYAVKHVMNITDVGHLTSDADSGEDKMEVGAQRENRSAWEIADFYTKVFKQNLKELNIQEPTVWCKATDHITEQIALVKLLEKGGYTYLTSDGVYFDTSRVNKYGYLARLNVKGNKAGARVGLSDEKKNPTDFALWKFSPKDHKRQMEWQSPWGVGFPGWHIECSAMAMNYLGDTIDIHTGGIDHISIHHTNEIAQSESATGKQFAKYWMHVAFLTVDGKKMAKSTGNFYTLKDIVDKGYDPLSFRYLVLTAKYRAGLNFTLKSIGAAQEALNSLRRYIAEWEDTVSKPDAKAIDKFRKYINDDLDTPQAIAFLWKFVSSSIPNAVKRATILEFDKVLGLRLTEMKEIDIPDEVKALAQKRELFRKEGKWAESDKIREEIESRGYRIEDTTGGSEMKKISV